MFSVCLLEMETGEAVRTECGRGLSPVSAQCIEGFDVVTPQLGHFLCPFVLVPSVESVPSGAVPHRDRASHGPCPVSRTMSTKGFMWLVSLGSGLGSILNPQLLGM